MEVRESGLVSAVVPSTFSESDPKQMWTLMFAIFIKVSSFLVTAQFPSVGHAHTTAYATFQRANANRELWLTVMGCILDGTKNNIIV